MALGVTAHTRPEHTIAGLIKDPRRQLEVIFIVLEVRVMKDFIGWRNIRDRGNCQAAVAEVDDAALVERMGQRAHEIDVGEPFVPGVDYPVADIMTRIAIEGEDTRAGVDANRLQSNMQLRLLLLQFPYFFSAWTVHVEQTGHKAQVHRIAVGHDHKYLGKEPRQLAAIL